MSDYTQTVDFGDKDALTSGDPNKLVKGTELDTEFSNIATAIATKYDSSDLATQAQAEAGTNNTRLMTPLRTAQLAADTLTGIVKIKSADETINNSNTLQADDHLASYTLEASKTYIVQAIMNLEIKANSDWRYHFEFAGADPDIYFMSLAYYGDTTGAGVFAGYDGVDDTQGANTGNNENMLIQLHGIVTTNASTTGVTFQWAPSNAVAENTVLKQGSYLAFYPID